MKQSLVYMYLPSGIFLLHLMAKEHVMALVVQWNDWLQELVSNNHMHMNNR